MLNLDSIILGTNLVTPHNLLQGLPLQAALTRRLRDIAIMGLKQMTGVEVLAEMKKPASTVRAIMVTGYPTVETAQASLRLGADEYCVKPIDNEELEEKVARVLES